MISHKTNGTCARHITFDLAEGKLVNVRFEGGCNGNLQGLTVLLEGMDAAEAAAKLRGIQCGSRGTSCPDQLAQAIEAAKD